MKILTIICAALSIGACAATEENTEDTEPDAVKDFIAVNELEEVGSIRTFHRLEQTVLNDYYVVITVRKDNYLLAYTSLCRRFQYSRKKPDTRRDSRALYAKSDTYRGCRIGALYPVSDAQADELREIGLAPGER